MNYVDLFNEQSVLLNLQSPDADSALAAMVDQMAVINPELADRKEELLAALITRESQGSTGDAGVGMPHVKMAGISNVTVVVGVHPEGLDFSALDGGMVKVFFCLVRPEEGAEEHLGLLRWLAGIAQHQDFVSFSVQANEAQQVIDLLSELAVA